MPIFESLGCPVGVEVVLGTACLCVEVVAEVGTCEYGG